MLGTMRVGRKAVFADLLGYAIGEYVYLTPQRRHIRRPRWLRGPV